MAEVKNKRIFQLIPSIRTIKLDEKKMEAGWAGKVFGMGENTPINYGGIISIIVVVIIGAVCILKPVNDAIEIIKSLLPIITLAFGYMFGARKNIRNQV